MNHTGNKMKEKNIEVGVNSMAIVVFQAARISLRRQTIWRACYLALVFMSSQAVMQGLWKTLAVRGEDGKAGGIFNYCIGVRFLRAQNSENQNLEMGPDM